MNRKKKKTPRGPKRCFELDDVWDRWMVRYQESSHLSFKQIIQLGLERLQESKNGGGE